LSLAAVIGGLIGLNRDLHNKPAGVRTHALVALGGALAVMTAETLSVSGEHQADIVSRVIQGVITGIGFLGAGVILRDPGEGQVHGLTTAAAIWVTSLFGIACGAGARQEVGLGVVLVFVVLTFGGPFERFCHRRFGPPPGENRSR
jgi:putative Mg2+ transporter-C (MgtC) family protein